MNSVLSSKNIPLQKLDRVRTNNEILLRQVCLDNNSDETIASCIRTTILEITSITSDMIVLLSVLRECIVILLRANNIKMCQLIFDTYKVDGQLNLNFMIAVKDSQMNDVIMNLIRKAIQIDSYDIIIFMLTYTAFFWAKQIITNDIAVICLDEEVNSNFLLRCILSNNIMDVIDAHWDRELFYQSIYKIIYYIDKPIQYKNILDAIPERYLYQALFGACSGNRVVSAQGLLEKITAECTEPHKIDELRDYLAQVITQATSIEMANVIYEVYKNNNPNNNDYNYFIQTLMYNSCLSDNLSIIDWILDLSTEFMFPLDCIRYMIKMDLSDIVFTHILKRTDAQVHREHIDYAINKVRSHFKIILLLHYYSFNETNEFKKNYNH
jgi:hypothetical protein